MIFFYSRSELDSPKALSSSRGTLINIINRCVPITKSPSAQHRCAFPSYTRHLTPQLEPQDAILFDHVLHRTNRYAVSAKRLEVLKATCTIWDHAPQRKRSTEIILNIPLLPSHDAK